MPSSASARTRSAAKTKPPTRMGMAMSGLCSALAISLASKRTRAAMSSAVKRMVGFSAIGSKAHFQVARGRGRAGKARQKGCGLARFQDLDIGCEIPMIKLVIAGVAQGHAHALRHRQVAIAFIDDGPRHRQHHLAVFVLAMIIDMG